MKIFRFIIPLLLISCINTKGTIVNKYYEPKIKYTYLTKHGKKTHTDNRDYVFIIVDSKNRYRIEVSKRKWNKYEVGDEL